MVGQMLRRHLHVAHILVGTFEYEEYISLKSINDPNEGYAQSSAEVYVPQAEQHV